MNFNLGTHVSKRLLHKTVAVFFLTTSYSCCYNNSKSVESAFCMKTVKSRLFKKYLKRRKLRARFCLPFGCLHISEKKLLKTAVLLVQELIK